MGCSPNLGILWLWLLVRVWSPSLQAVASTPKRGAATFCKAFISLNMLFAEIYLASASWLHCREVSVTSLQPKCYSSAQAGEAEVGEDASLIEGGEGLYKHKQ